MLFLFGIESIFSGFEIDPSYIQSIEKYIYDHEQDSLESDLTFVEASGLITINYLEELLVVLVNILLGIKVTINILIIGMEVIT